MGNGGGLEPEPTGIIGGFFLGAIKGAFYGGMVVAALYAVAAGVIESGYNTSSDIYFTRTVISEILGGGIIIGAIIGAIYGCYKGFKKEW